MLILEPHLQGSSCVTKLNYSFDEWFEIFQLQLELDEVHCLEPLLLRAFSEPYYLHSFDPVEVVWIYKDHGVVGERES